MNRTFLISGPVHSGKTTRLQSWINLNNYNKVDGILAPVLGGKRYLLHISSNEMRKLELIENDTRSNFTNIGKYTFDNSVFEWANEKLMNLFNTLPEYVIIDEIGPLELQGQGLEPAVSELLVRRRAELQNIIVIVRSTLMEQFFMHYRLDPGDFSLMNLGI